MKNFSLLFIGLFMIPMFLLTSCDRGEDPVVTDSSDKFVYLKDYMLTNQYDLNHVNGGTGLASPSFVISPSAAKTVIESASPYALILDIRAATGAEGFASGKIAGAVNVEFKNILTEVDKITDVTKPILVVCYTGNQATYATALLRMYGYRNAVALKWGMAGWNKTLFGARWFNGLGNTASSTHSSNFNAPPQATSAPTAPTNLFAAPTFTNTATVGSELLKNRVKLVVSEGYKGVSASTVLTTPTDYYINNYFSDADNKAYGYIKGAYRIQPITLANSDHLKLNPTAKIVTYCYTGQTSGVVTAWLRVLGYDAYSLTQGMNAIWNTNPGWGASGNRWDAVNAVAEAQTYPIN
jgi:rhodanese-related sulfurtransferase